MKEKIGLIITIFLTIALLAIIIKGPSYQNEQLKIILADNELKEPIQPIEPPIATNLSQKLKLGETIELLVIGNGIGQGIGAQQDEDKWFNMLSNSILDMYSSHTNMELMTIPGADVFSTWIDYSFTESSAHDLVFIVLGQEEISEWKDLDDFSYFYENLLRKIISDNPKAEIMAVIEHGLDSSRANMIKELAEYYEVSFVNMKEVFEKSEKDIPQLTIDGSLPNEQGNSLYSKEIFGIIRNFTYANKENDHREKQYLHKEAKKVSEINTISNFEMVDGAVTLTFSGTMVGLSFKTGESNGIADIYIDGQYIQSFDTYQENVEIARHVLISSNLENGEHVMTIQPSILINEKASGTNIELLSVITN